MESGIYKWNCVDCGHANRYGDKVNSQNQMLLECKVPVEKIVKVQCSKCAKQQTIKVVT